MAKILLDTSAVMCVLNNEPSRDRVIAVTQSHELFLCESIRVEIANAITAAMKQRRTTVSDATNIWLQFEDFVPGCKVLSVKMTDVISLADKFKLYAYDAIVLVTAASAGLHLLSFDRRMTVVAAQMGLSLVDLS